VKAQFEERRLVPWIGREVDPGEIVEVPDVDLASYLEAGWQPEGKAKQGGKPGASGEEQA
jgi:hypothetical protein